MHIRTINLQMLPSAFFSLNTNMGARWRSGKLSDSESRGSEFDPHRRHRVVSLSQTHSLHTVLGKPRKSWLPPDMTEKLLTGTFSLNTNKHIQTQMFMMHITIDISGICRISTIVINKPLKEILQLSKGMACCVVSNKTLFNADIKLK